MELVPGEYEFSCYECDGDGSVQVVHANDGEEPELIWAKCEDCRGTGVFLYDETEAAEAIECGRTPLRTPPGA